MTACKAHSWRKVWFLMVSSPMTPAVLHAELGLRHVRVTNIEPGLTHSELADHVDPAVDRGTLAGLFSTVHALSSDDIADLVAYVTSRPAHVNVRQVIALPVEQV